MVRVLERLGHTVEFPAGQTCCGQMHYNTGYQADALTLLPRFVEQFRGSEAVVAPSTSCVTMMRDHYPSMAQRLQATGKHDGIVAEVDALLPRVVEFSEFLTKRLGLTDVGAYFPHRVTYHASCHGLRGLGRRAGEPAAGSEGHRPGKAAGCGALLRVWWDVCGQECGRFERHAGGEDSGCVEYRSGDVHSLR